MAPPRSWCSATGAPGRAGSASSTPASRWRPTPTSRRGWPKPSIGWASTTRCSRWSPATISTTAGWPTSRHASRRSGCAARRHAVETLISDVKGDAASLDVLFAVRPDVLNHNIETVARLQRAVRPSAGYARSLSVLARAKAAGLVTKSSLIVGMGETDDEVIGCLADLAGIGVDIVTIGQYLRPTSHHLPVARWVEPPSSFGGRRSASNSASATSRPARSPDRATTPRPPPTTPPRCRVG